VILTVACWLAALSPALADVRPVRAPAPPPVPAGDDPVRVGIGIGGELIAVLDHDGDNGDEDEDGDGLVGLLVGDGEGDDDEDHDGVVGRLLEVLFGEEEDSASATPVAVIQPADDDDGLVGELLELPEDIDLLEDVGDGVEELLESTAHGLEVTFCILDRVLNKPPGGGYIPCALP
jgi:hypothetical protein